MLALHRTDSNPVAVRLLMVFLPLGYVMCLLAPTFTLSHLALVPWYSFLRHSYAWNILTGALLENNLLLLIAGLAVLHVCGTKLEAACGTKRFLILLGIVAIVTNILIIVLAALSYPFGGRALYEYYAGFLPCAMAILVSCWGLFRDGVVAGPLKFSHLPFALICYSTVHEIAFYGTAPPLDDPHDLYAGSDLLPALIGLCVAWVYLRFFVTAPLDAQTTSSLVCCRCSGGGDPSPQFAFHMLFPMPLRVIVLFVSSAVFPLVRAAGFGKAIVEAQQAALQDLELTEISAGPLSSSNGQLQDANSSTAASKVVAEKIMVPASHSELAQPTLRPLPGSTLLEADRRRQVALAALAERLERAQKGDSPATPPLSPAELKGYV